MSAAFQTHTQKKFAAHETFAPRFGWLRKAHTAVTAHPADLGDPDTSDAAVQQSNGQPSDVFLRPDAPVILGVGKNMVNAIRFWAQAFGVTVEAPRGGTSRANLASVTADGDWLLGPDGVDPWLEDPASLWVLHWWLLRPRCLVPTWWAAFNLLPGGRFHEDDLASLVASHISLAGWEAVMPSSIAKDIDCLTKMYAPRRTATRSPGSVEDMLDCPFRELGLLESVPGASRTWRFADVARIAVPPAVATYAALDYMHAHELSGQVTLARLAHEPGAVGRTLRLSELDLAGAIDEVAAHTPGLRVSDSIGQRSLVVEGDPGKLATAVLDGHYAPKLAANRPHVRSGTSRAPAASSESVPDRTTRSTSRSQPARAVTSPIRAAQKAGR